jgi:hypothetical protein
LVPELPLKLGHIVETESYGLSPARTYTAAMSTDGDFDHPADKPIRQIISQPAGPILTARWRADVFKWFRQTPMGQAETVAAEQALSFAPE